MSLSETTVRLLKYDFTEEETKGLADQIMENLKSLSRFEGELKTIKAQYKAQNEKAVADNDVLRQKYEDGYEMRNIDCRIDRDFESNVKRVIRTDTDEVVEEVAIPNDERQMMIDEVEEEESDDKVHSQAWPSEKTE